MEKTYVNEKTLVGEIVNQYPEAIDVLLDMGMHCLGCPASQGESLEDACAVHSIAVDGILEKINGRIAESRK